MCQKLLRGQLYMRKFYAAVPVNLKKMYIFFFFSFVVSFYLRFEDS